MKTHHLSLVLCTLCAATAWGAPSAEIPVWLYSRGNPNPGSLEVFDAFHSKSGPIKGSQTGTSSSVRPPLLDAPPAIYPNEFRDFDGSGNNRTSHLGTAGTVHLRTTTVGYGDGAGTPAGAAQLGPRVISNFVNAQADVIPNSDSVSSFVWQWGQLIDHDMSLTRVANPAEQFDIIVPPGDPQFDPQNRGNKLLPFQRSAFTVINGVREQINANTAFIDGSQVYGSDPSRARGLRTFDGTGHLTTGANNLLPFNLAGFANQPGQGDPTTFYLAGDVRVNENIGLTVLQTVLMREHNFWADSIKTGDPTLDDDGIYFRARAIVTAEIEMITYRDFLPILLGPNALTPYLGYNSAVDPRVALVFSTAAFRVGHTFLPPILQELNFRNVSIGNLQLGLGFFHPNLITAGIEPFLRGLARQIPQQVDPYVIDAVRNFQIGGARSQGFDLASLNIQRGRDHGLPGYNQVRIDYGLAPKATFAEMTSNLDIQARLASAYASPNDVDVWVGGLSEDHFNGGQIGETFFTILKDQFQRSRDGDRFWYESYLDAATLATVQQQTLSIIIKRNTTIVRELQDDAFHVPPSS